MLNIAMNIKEALDIALRHKGPDRLILLIEPCKLSELFAAMRRPRIQSKL